MRMTIGVFMLALAAASAFATGPSSRDSYVLRDGDVTWMQGEGMSADALKQIQGRFGREFLWARRNGQTFVSHDEGVLDQARSVVVRKIGRSEQEARLAAITDAAIRQAVARRVR